MSSFLRSILSACGVLAAPAFAQTPSQPPPGPGQSYSGHRVGPWDAAGPVVTVTNTGPLPAYGTRLNYLSQANAPGFDLAAADIGIARAPEPNGTSYLAHWFVQVSPLDQTHRWASTAAEMNPVNRGEDPGWTDDLHHMPRLTGGLRVVPESVTFGEPGTGRNVEFAYAVSASSGKNADGRRAASYNGLMIESDSIGPNGRGVLAMGSTVAEPARENPSTPFEVRKNWQGGMTTVGASFGDGVALHLGTGQAIALTDDGKVILKTNSDGSQVDIFGRGKRLLSLDLATGDLRVAGKVIQGFGR